MTRDGSPKDESATLSKAVALLARRPLTRRELRARLAASGHDPDAVANALDRLERERLIDDARLARQWIEARSTRRGFGLARLARELEARGVDEGVVRDAIRDVVDVGDVDPDAVLRRQVEKRVRAAGGRRDRAAYARVYNALLRAGHDPTAIREALSGFFRESNRHSEVDSEPDET